MARLAELDARLSDPNHAGRRLSRPWAGRRDDIRRARLGGRDGGGGSPPGVAVLAGLRADFMSPENHLRPTKERVLSGGATTYPCESPTSR